MAATEITRSTRFFAAGTSKCLWVPTIAELATPTRAELDAGTDLSPEIADLEGWTVEGEPIETPDMGTTFTGNIPGRTSAEDSNLTLYADQGGEDVRQLLARNAAGFIVWMDGGDVDGSVMDVFPVRVLSRGMQRSVEDEATRVQVQFSVTSEPAEAVTIPAVTP